MKQQTRELITQYLQTYYPEHDWKSIAFTAELTGEIITIHDSAGVKPMFGQRAFLNFGFRL